MNARGPISPKTVFRDAYRNGHDLRVELPRAIAEGALSADEAAHGLAEIRAGWKATQAQERRDREPAPASNYARLDNVRTEPPPPRESIWDGNLPRRHVALLSGDGGVGKSMLIQALATHIPAGLPFAGLATTSVPVLYFSTEDDVEEVRRRQVAIDEAYGTGSDGHPGLYIDARAGLDSMMARPALGALEETAFYRHVLAEAKRLGAGLVILDNLAQVNGGSEIDRAAVSQFARMCGRIAQEANAAVLLVGHVAKAEGSQYSGSTAWNGAVRTRLYLKRDADGTLLLERAKANLSATGAQLRFEWRGGCFVPVATGQHSERMQEAREVLLKTLVRETAAFRATSHKEKAQTYLPRLIDPALGLPKALVAHALAGLLSDGVIVADAELPWRKADRRKARGLALVGDETR